MGIRTRTGLAAALGTLAIGMATAAGTGVAAADVDCNPSFIGGANYLSRLCGVPDYDQRRVSGTLMGDGRSINIAPGLKGDGSCHCVPTSFTDLLGYYVHKGVKGAFPPKFDWDSGRPGYVARPGVAAADYLNGQPFSSAERAAYNQTTFTIGTLGQGVKTGDEGCGTSFSNVLGYFNLLRALYPAGNFLPFYLDPGKTAPKNIANMLAGGATVSIAYGRYDGYNESGGVSAVSWGARTGGHVVAIREVSGSATTGQFGLADPASVSDPVEAGGEDKFRQSTFATRNVALTRVFNPSKGQWRWRVGDANPSGSTRILDGILVVWPLSVVMASGNQVKVLPGIEFANTGTSAPPPAPSNLKVKTFRFSSAVLDAALLPGTGELAVLLKGDGSVRTVSLGTGEKRVIGKAPTGATQLEANPAGSQLFVGGTSELVQFDPREDVPKLVKKIPVPGPVRALTYDTSLGAQKGKLVAITADRGLHLLTPDTLSVDQTRRLSKTFLAGSGPLFAAVDAKGQLVLRRGSAGDLRVIGVRSGTPKRRTLSSLSGLGGLVLTDRGSLLTVRAGKLLDLSPGGATVKSSALGGRAGGGRILAVTRLGTDLPLDRADEIIDGRVIDPDFPEMAP